MVDPNKNKIFFTNLIIMKIFVYVVALLFESPVCYFLYQLFNFFKQNLLLYKLLYFDRCLYLFYLFLIILS